MNIEEHYDNFFCNIIVIVVGFEAVDITAEETLPFVVIATVALFQGQVEREFVVGVRTLNGTAKG